MRPAHTVEASYQSIVGGFEKDHARTQAFLVELGKSLGAKLLPLLDAGAAKPLSADIDASTAGLLRRLGARR